MLELKYYIICCSCCHILLSFLLYVDQGKFGLNTGNIFTKRFQQIKIKSYIYLVLNIHNEMNQKYYANSFYLKQLKKWISKVPQKRINFRHANNTYMYYYECITSL